MNKTTALGEVLTSVQFLTAGDPRPPRSKRLGWSETDVELWRLRLDR